MKKSRIGWKHWLGRDWDLSCKSNGKGNGRGNGKVMEREMEFTCVAALKAGEGLGLKLQE